MIVVIDGYNLLKQIFPGNKTNLEAQRKHFIKQLAHYQNKKIQDINQIIVVFDAGPSNHATRIVKSGIAIIFSGIKSSADNWIINFVERNQHKELLIVTLDRELKNACRKLGADTFSVFDFYSLMQHNLLQESQDSLPGDIQQPTSSLEKYEPVALLEETWEKPSSSDALDLLMEQESFNIHTTKSEDKIEESCKRRGKAFTLSKKEKHMLDKIKKLK